MEIFNSIDKAKVVAALKELDEKQPKNDAEIEIILNRHGLKRLADGRLVPLSEDPK